MNTMTVTDARTLPTEVRRQKEAEQLRSLIRTQEEKAQSTERYLRMFGRCMTAERVQMLQRHLQRTIESIWSMRCDLEALQCPPGAVADL